MAEWDLTGDPPRHQVFNPALFARSLVRHEQGRYAESLADALEVGRRYSDWGIRRAVPPWRSHSAILLARQGEHDDARRLAEEEVVLAERWGTTLAEGLARRGLGLVTGELDTLADAVGRLEASPAQLEIARARIDLGAARRRAGERAGARAPLRAGMDLADRCGARPLAERGREELLATGARPRRFAASGTAALTASERRVAALAAGGLTNRGIAQELFLTTATVETHLRHAFQKLDVGARDQLADALALDSSGSAGQKLGVAS